MIALLLCLCVALPDQLYQQGMALVKSGRLAEARAVFEAGEHQAPADKRFPIELAGLSYLQNDFRGAKQHLKKALRLDPNDNYANEFLGTLYFLDRNLEAALLYWNRLDKPRVRNVETGSLRLDPVLLDRAFAFSPATVLKLDDYRTTQTWLAGLDILRHSSLDLEADGGETFDVVLRASEKNGWAGVVPFFRGVFYQAVHPEFYNIQGKAVNRIGRTFCRRTEMELSLVCRWPE
jgi:tetratricopeptide (TPR) repeat protein